MWLEEDKTFYKIISKIGILALICFLLKLMLWPYLLLILINSQVKEMICVQ